MTEPFGGLLASFTLALDAEGKSPKTVENYSRAVLVFARWLREHHLVDDVAGVRADQVRGWLVSLRGKVAPSTEYRNYSGCRQFFAWCVREGELDVSPMVNVRPPKVPEPRTEMLTVDQMKALLAGCSGRDFVARRDTAIIALFADTGMRRAELAELTVDDLDLRARVAYVVGKGRRPRTVPFGARTAQALDRYLRVRRAQARADTPRLCWRRRTASHPDRRPGQAAVSLLAVEPARSGRPLLPARSPRSDRWPRGRVGAQDHSHSGFRGP
jgi:integrase/recombinase XerC